MKIERQDGELALPPVVHMDETRGLRRLVVLTKDCEAILYLHGAQLTHWRPTGAKPVLWMSSQSEFHPDKPLRGGVPICFPWFARHPCVPGAPSHGFVRTMEWTVAEVRLNPIGEVVITLTLAPPEDLMRQWECRFDLSYTVTLGTALRMALTCRNTGDDLDVFTEALHTYFAVGDARQASVYGLENVEYIDKTLENSRHRQGGEPVVVRGELDRLYVNTRAACILNDPAWGRTITVAKTGSEATVIWNPHSDKAAAMTDFGDEEWLDMLCIETANAGDSAVSLYPGDSHTMEARIVLT